MDGEKQFQNPRFEALFNQAIYSIAIYDRDGKILEVNKAWEILFQNTLKDLGDYSLLNDSQVRDKGLLPYIEAGYAGRSIKVPPFLYDPAELGLGGKAVWIEVSISPIKDNSGTVNELAVIMKDITEQVQSRKKLEESEWKFRNLTNLIPMLIWTANRDGAIEYFNEQWHDFMDEKDIPSEKWKEIIHPDDRDAMLERRAYAMKTGTQYENLHRLRKKDGQYRWMLSRAIPIKDVNGQITKWFGASTDLTEMIILPHQKEEINQILHH